MSVVYTWSMNKYTGHKLSTVCITLMYEKPESSFNKIQYNCTYDLFFSISGKLYNF